MERPRPRSSRQRISTHEFAVAAFAGARGFPGSVHALASVNTVLKPFLSRNSALLQCQFSPRDTLLAQRSHDGSTRTKDSISQPQGDSNEYVEFPRQDDAIRSGIFVRRVRIISICIGSAFAYPKRREKDPARAVLNHSRNGRQRNSLRSISATPDKYDRFVQVGMAAWLESNPRDLTPGWPSGHRHTIWSNVPMALATSDEYVWCWSEHTDPPPGMNLLFKW